MRERRWLLCFLVAMCCTLSTWALPSQDKTVTLNLRNVSIETALNAVKKQTGVNMLYNSQMFKGVSPVSVNVKNERWEVTLKLILNPKGFDYAMKDGIVVIRRMHTEKRVNRIRGTVFDANKEPIPGASIIVKGTRTGTSTNIEGEFTLDVRDDKVALEISFIGMKKQTLQVDASRKKMLEITLVDDVKTLDDVVVTGYSNVRKTSFTGSSTQISGDDLRKVSQTNVIGALQTFDPSFRLVSNAQFGSDPNALPEMYIRGRSGFGVKELDKDQLSKSNLENNPNLPTFIMDGFEVSIEKIYDLDPTRIESMTILKDAAATAIYGSRAANGVILVTTKGGKDGRVSVKYNMYYQMKENPKLLETMDPYDYVYNTWAYMKSLGDSYGDGVARYFGLGSKYGNHLNEYKNMTTHNYINDLMQTASSWNHDVSLSGGTDKTKFYSSVNYMDDEGIRVKSGFQRWNANFKLTQKINKKLTADFDLRYSEIEINGSGFGNATSAYTYRPVDNPLGDASFTAGFGQGDTNMEETSNPLYYLNTVDYIKNMYRIRAKGALTWNVIKGLTAKTEPALLTRIPRRWM